MFGQQWETPFHPANLLEDLWTMMHPAWQAQLLDQEKIVKTAQAVAAAAFDPVGVLRWQHDLFDAVLQNNLMALDIYKNACDSLSDMIDTAGSKGSVDP